MLTLTVRNGHRPLQNSPALTRFGLNRSVRCLVAVPPNKAAGNASEDRITEHADGNVDIAGQLNSEPAHLSGQGSSSHVEAIDEQHHGRPESGSAFAAGEGSCLKASRYNNHLGAQPFGDARAADEVAAALTSLPCVPLRGSSGRGGVAIAPFMSSPQQDDAAARTPSVLHDLSPDGIQAAVADVIEVATSAPSPPSAADPPSSTPPHLDHDGSAGPYPTPSPSGTPEPWQTTATLETAQSSESWKPFQPLETVTHDAQLESPSTSPSPPSQQQEQQQEEQEAHLQPQPLQPKARWQSTCCDGDGSNGVRSAPESSEDLNPGEEYTPQLFPPPIRDGSAGSAGAAPSSVPHQDPPVQAAREALQRHLAHHRAISSTRGSNPWRNKVLAPSDSDRHSIKGSEEAVVDRGSTNVNNSTAAGTPTRPEEVPQNSLDRHGSGDGPNEGGESVGRSRSGSGANTDVGQRGSRPPPHGAALGALYGVATGLLLPRSSRAPADLGQRYRFLLRGNSTTSGGSGVEGSDHTGGGDAAAVEGGGSSTSNAAAGSQPSGRGRGVARSDAAAARTPPKGSTAAPTAGGTKGPALGAPPAIIPIAPRSRGVGDAPSDHRTRARPSAPRLLPLVHDQVSPAPPGLIPSTHRAKSLPPPCPPEDVRPSDSSWGPAGARLPPAWTALGLVRRAWRLLGRKRRQTSDGRQSPNAHTDAGQHGGEGAVTAAASASKVALGFSGLGENGRTADQAHEALAWLEASAEEQSRLAGRLEEWAADHPVAHVVAQLAVLRVQMHMLRTQTALWRPVELLNGRLALIGLTSGLLQEATSGTPLAQQAAREPLAIPLAFALVVLLTAVYHQVEPRVRLRTRGLLTSVSGHRWLGRLAMVAIVWAVVQEAADPGHRPVLQQVREWAAGVATVQGPATEAAAAAAAVAKHQGVQHVGPLDWMSVWW